MESYKKLLLANRAWVEEKLSVKADYFERTYPEQKPEFLWIGCADSRVPETDITGTEQGDIFVHRNIANLVVHTDFNFLSVLQYAVETLHVKHIVICGHYGCGGVLNAMSHKDLGLLNKWLRYIKDVYRYHEAELEAIGDEKARFDRLVELNVIEQCRNVTETSIVQRAWEKEHFPYVHGWVYDIRTGLIKDLALLKPGEDINSIYHYDFGTPDDKRH
ncbi:MAG: carbonic anhydrase [Ignavibacteria bacterium]|nr:carbonic anhydrase [Ignavibacteria bacterium]